MCVSILSKFWLQDISMGENNEYSFPENNIFTGLTK